MVPFATFTGHQGPIYCLVHGAATGTFLSGSGDGRVVRWSVRHPDQGELLVNVGEAVFAMYLDESVQRLWVGAEGGALHVIDLRSGLEKRHFTVHRKGVFGFVALPDDRLLCTSGDGTVSVWRRSMREAADGIELLRQVPLCEEKLRGAALAPDGSLIAVACGDGCIRLLETGLFNEVHILPGHPGGAQSVAWHPEKPVLLSGGKDGHLRTWHADEQFRPLTAVPAHRAGIYAIAFNLDHLQLATASRDKSAKLWDAGSLDPLARLDLARGGHTHSVNALCWQGSTLLTAGDDRRIIAWSL